MSLLRDPANPVSPNAPRLWRVSALGGLAVTLAIVAALRLFLPWWPWWAWLIAAAAVAADLCYIVVMPGLRYRLHRWEVTDEAVYTRTGWLTTELRIAPLSRVQTVDSVQGPLMRLFGLASVTVTTASAAGPITIEGLDAPLAQRLVAELTSVTAASQDDAT